MKKQNVFKNGNYCMYVRMKLKFRNPSNPTNPGKPTFLLMTDFVGLARFLCNIKNIFYSYIIKIARSIN